MLFVVMFVAIVASAMSARVRYEYAYKDSDLDPHNSKDYYHSYGSSPSSQYQYDDYSAPSSDYGNRGYSYGNQDYAYGNQGYGTNNYAQDNMARSQKSYQPQSHREKVYVPVVIKKKKSKKMKILSVHNGFYVPGGTQMFGKFKDLFSCKKACEITPTCFSGDFNPWLGKCYLHSNLTACGNMRSHKAITHFKKVPCSILETNRGFLALGVSVINGIEISGIKSLSDCIKKCATAGGGIASTDTNIVAEGQVCCHIDYDFASHKCYFHPCVDMATAQAQFCWPLDVLADPPLNSIANPTTVSITMCPRSKL